MGCSAPTPVFGPTVFANVSKRHKFLHRQFYKGAFRVDDGNSGLKDGRDGDVKCHASCELEHFAHEVLTIGFFPVPSWQQLSKTVL